MFSQSQIEHKGWTIAVKQTEEAYTWSADLIHPKGRLVKMPSLHRTAGDALQAAMSFIDLESSVAPSAASKEFLDRLATA